MSFSHRNSITNGEDVITHDLVARAKEGNSDAQNKIFMASYPRLLNVCARYMGDYHNGEDATQEAMLIAHVNLPKFNGVAKNGEGVAKFSTWLTRIGITQCITLFRKRKSSVLKIVDDDIFLFLDDKLKEEMPDPLELMTRDELRMQVRLVLQKLTKEHREIIILFFQENLSYERIAETLEISSGTVRSRLHRACKMALELLLQTAEEYMEGSQENTGSSKKARQRMQSDKTEMDGAPSKEWRHFESLADLYNQTFHSR